jgi:hypothetical protein
MLLVVSGAGALLLVAGALGPLSRAPAKAPHAGGATAAAMTSSSAHPPPVPSAAPSPRAGRAQDSLRSANAPRAASGSPPLDGPSPWWLEPGPAVEVRIGTHRVRAAPARLDSDALEAVEAGDRITLALPEVGALDVVVQRVSSPSPSVRQLQGHLADPDESYAVTFTLGPVLAFANVTTPTGTWIAEFENGTGWVLYDDLAERLVDYRNTDARVPPRGGEAG